jgi:hypothetical protein
MYAQVRNVITKMKTSFSSRQLMLFPLPIQGMFYHWSCDFAKEPQTSTSNVYIMIMIEHFSKWVELVALLDKLSHNTNQAFLQQTLSKFGACAECLIDQGSEFKGEFQDLHNHALIDHCRTSRIIPKLMALQRGWLRHARRDFRRFDSLGTKRIGTWPYLTSLWVT